MVEVACPLWLTGHVAIEDDPIVVALFPLIEGEVYGALRKRHPRPVTILQGYIPKAPIALALALAGDSSKPRNFMNDLQRRFPDYTSVRFNYLPVLAGRLALNHKDPGRAIEALQAAAPDELGMPRSALHANFGSLYPIYVRGEAYLALHDGQRAAAEFEKILHHPGIIISDPIGALAHLQLGRALLLAGEKAKTKAVYQDFLGLWKDGDLNTPILKEAKAEYKKLQ